jgi:hypothetical protein
MCWWRGGEDKWDGGAGIGGGRTARRVHLYAEPIHVALDEEGLRTSRARFGEEVG